MTSRSTRTAMLRRLPLLLPVALAACSAPRSPLPPMDGVIEQLQPLYTDRDTGRPEDRRLTNCLATPLAEQRVCRDTLVQAMMAAIDLRYAEFEIAFFDANRTVGFGSSVAVLGLGTAGALAATGTAQVLNAISAAVTGSREAFGREVLAEQTAAALLTAMRNARNEVALRIREGIRRDATDYPLGVAFSDLQAYFRAGTLPGAIAGLTQVIGDRAQITQDELRRAVPVAQGPASRCLLGLISARVTPVAAERQENRRRMRSLMDGLGIPASVDLAEFAADAAPARAAQQRTVAEGLGCRL